jgi:P pilus assembly chaperone PapD
MRLARLLFTTLCAVGVLSAFTGESAVAQLQVLPTQVFIVHPNRSAELAVTNVTQKTVEVEATFLFEYPVAYDTGRVEFKKLAEGDTSPSNAAPWLRTVPDKAILAPGESRTLRVVVQPPATVTDGEYWARVILRAQPTAAPENQSKKTGFVPMLISEMNLPVHYRRGTLITGVRVDELTAAVQDSALRVSLRLARTGNTCFWGRASFRVSNSSGKVVETRTVPMVVYDTMFYQNVVDLSGLPSGTYALDVMLDTKHPNLRRDYQMNAQPVSQSVPFTIP